MKMQAALWYGPEDLRVEETDVPEIASGEILVKIGAALTCGTDFKFFRRGHPRLVRSLPSAFGHEMAGTVVAVGAAVRDVRIGDRVVAANSAPCGDCFFCRRGEGNLCDHLEFLNGAYAEYIRIPERIVARNLYPVPASVSFEEAALTEPLACAVRCMENSGLKLGESLCVVGAGPCGLLFVQLGKLMGARVICVGRSEEKLEVARRLGADDVFSTLHSADIVGEVRKAANDGRGPDLVIEAAGLPETWELSVALARKGGRVCFYGGCSRGTEVKFGTERIHYEELTLTGVFHHTPQQFSKALQLIAERKIRVSPLIVARKKLSELQEIFRKGVSENPLKIAIVPD